MQGLKHMVACLLWIFSTAVAPGQGLIFEAENGTLTGTVTVQHSQPGFSGTGYVERFETDGDMVTIGFSLEAEGYYNLFIGYAAPYGQKINIININGNTAEVTFPGSSTFKEVLFGKIKLKPGNNSISIIKNWGWFLVDYLRIEKDTDPLTSVAVPYPLVTPEPMDETNRLFCYLEDRFTTGIHSGAMSLNAIEEAEWLFAQTGKYPALIGLDFMNHTRDWEWFNKDMLVEETCKWYKKNGLVAICWHWRDPSRTTDEFYTDKTAFDVSKITDTGSPEYAAMIGDIDIVAQYIRELQDSAVPFLFRPLHEASGKWFWWGAKGPEPCKALWRLMFDRMVNHHGLRNVIWVWTTDTKPDNMDWYPGDGFVDILGADIYSSNGDVGSQVLTFNKIRDDFSGKKLITLSENGMVPDPDNLVADDAAWSWFMTWYGDFVRNPDINPLSHWLKVMNHPYVITLDEMPDLKSYPTGTATIPPSDIFHVFYNMADECLHIDPVASTGNYDFYLYDLSGRMHHCEMNNNGSLSVSLTSLPNGIYLVRIISMRGSSSYKILKGRQAYSW